MSADAAFPSSDPALERLAPDLARRLAGAGVATRTVEHEAVFTVDEAQALRGTIPGVHTKNLFVKDKKGRHFLVTAAEDTPVDLKTLHGRIGASGRLSFSDAERMGRMLGVEPGSVTVLGLVNDRAGEVTLVLDERLLEHDILNAHPLTNRATTSLPLADLLRFLGATGHEPIVTPLSEASNDGAPS
ncbi:prolyl-tRNA synthetase associated domain-containing protein [Aureimonas sp. AU4]|uniref:prolyl-tRNA synthetase associated domain-containing protein n=1 Tax=Aureimonas sp. AU4 TaxID=1638163 RepID=UPI000781CDC6|nr:prolyl-tRNA synthetase associated domain-containing protein [Aureimonas sp. AU4]